MEKKMKRIPFEIELAKAIAKGEKDGRIITSDGSLVRILCFDKADSKTPIVALYTHQPTQDEFLLQCSEDGICSGSYGIKLVIEVPDSQQFKEGDVICNNDEVAIYNGIDKYNNFLFTVCMSLRDKKVSFNWGSASLFDCARLSTEEERKDLISALMKDGSSNARKYLIRYFGIDLPYKFEPFDKVLARSTKHEVWHAAIYSHYDEKRKTHVANSVRFQICIPYNDQTKHLLGTTDDWSE